MEVMILSKKGKEYLCYECGTKMDKADEKVLVCPNCDHSVDIKDYSNEEEIYEDIFGVNDNIHCVGCDGPWPVCSSTCKLYNQN